MAKNTKTREYIVQEKILRLGAAIEAGLSVTVPGVAQDTTAAAIQAAVESIDSTLSNDDLDTLVKFIYDGVATQVIEDTITPSNNRPLPVKLTGAAGDINITAGDLNVQSSHIGVDFDSIRIGDGIELLTINADGSLNVIASLSSETDAGNVTTDTLRTVESTDSVLNTNVGNILNSVNVTDRYNISRLDESTATGYYGFVDIVGNWYIMKADNTTGITTYAKGSTDFLTNWANRSTTLTYDEFNNLTW